MENKTLKSLIFIAIVFLMIAFIKGEINPFLWGWGARFWLVVVCGLYLANQFDE
jgi:hypothetical protein